MKNFISTISLTEYVLNARKGFRRLNLFSSILNLIFLYSSIVLLFFIVYYFYINSQRTVSFDLCFWDVALAFPFLALVSLRMFISVEAEIKMARYKIGLKEKNPIFKMFIIIMIIWILVNTSLFLFEMFFSMSMLSKCLENTISFSLFLIFYCGIRVPKIGFYLKELEKRRAEHVAGIK